VKTEDIMTETKTNNEKSEAFQYLGVNHVALVCRDMAETVAFYDGVLGMKLNIGLLLGSGD